MESKLLINNESDRNNIDKLWFNCLNELIKVIANLK